MLGFTQLARVAAAPCSHLTLVAVGNASAGSAKTLVVFFSADLGDTP
jgi:hypothetical protein